jgi:hypothetical protein
MGALLFLFVIATVSLLAVRVGSTALMMTGLSWDAASFQAYSAFFGVGFTTREAEMVVRHPVRRRIIRDLIFAGNVGLTSALATLIVTFVSTTGTKQTLTTMGIILAGLMVLVLLTKLGFMTRGVDFVIRRSLERVGVVRPRDYDLLLHVQSGYCVSEVEISEDSWLANKALKDSRPADRGLIAG